MPAEIEAKFLNVNPVAIRTKLQNLGYNCAVPRRLMNRATLHMPAETRNVHEWWRVRDEGNGRITMTWKCRVTDDVDGTEELEIDVSDFETAIKLLETTGMSVTARQETARETWIKDGVEVVIDEWPGLNPFIEIESSTTDMVHASAAALGFDMKDAVFGGVANVYHRELGCDHDEVNHWPVITFANPPSRKAA